jgi:hypothetical protein
MNPLADLIEGSAAAGGSGTEEGEVLHYAVAVKWKKRRAEWEIGVLPKK